MDQQYDYEEVREEGITLKKVGYFCKKVWLRAIVYLVIAALVTTAVAVPIKVYLKSEPVAQTSIEYVYDGIEEGLDPRGGALDTDNIISMTVLRNAVDSANLGGVITDITKLRTAMRVEGVMSAEYRKLAEAAANGDSAAQNALYDLSAYPTQFNIIISDPEGLGLTDDQATTLLNKIVKCYCDDFKNRFSTTTMFAAETFTLSSDGKNEFVYIYDIYTDQLEAIRDYLSTLSDKNSKFVSAANNTSFALLISELNVLQNRYDMFNATVMSNNVLRTKGDYVTALATSKEQLENRLKSLQDYAKSLGDLIELFQPNTTTTDSNGVHGVVVKYPDEYYEYYKKLDTVNRQIMSVKTQLDNIETRYNKFKDVSEFDDAAIAKAEADLAVIEADTRKFVEKANATIDDYFDTMLIASSVRQVRPPVITRRTLDFSLLLVYVVALIIGLLAAGLVTGVKIVKSNAVQKAAELGRKELFEGKETENE